MAVDDDGRIDYLSHDDGEVHGHVLAKDYDDLLLRCVPVACTGGEDCQWMPFTSSLQTMIRTATSVSNGRTCSAGVRACRFTSPDGMDVAEQMTKMIARRSDMSLGHVLTDMAGTDD